MNKIVMITGATSGIGLACAEKFATNGDNIILTGRRADRLNSIADELKSKYGIKVEILNFDVRDKEAVFTSVGTLSEEWMMIDILVNNAGLAVGLNTIQEGEIDDWERMIDTNVKGLLYVTRAILPGMVQRKSGHIINVGSIAGKEVYLNGNVYCGTKHAVDALTKAIRIDTVQYGIKVTQIAPGAVETEFSIVRFKGDKDRADGVYKGFEPLHPDDIADSIYYVTTLPTHVNINDLLIMPTAQASATYLHKEL
jgi:NADP-dependent 3-hydroxy acid dehydrogenase YdfG